jgi:hypothetical protein
MVVNLHVPKTYWYEQVFSLCIEEVEPFCLSSPIEGIPQLIIKIGSKLSDYTILDLHHDNHTKEFKEPWQHICKKNRIPHRAGARKNRTGVPVTLIN